MVTDNPIQIEKAYVGDWNGSTGIAIGDYTVISCKHCQGNLEQSKFRYRDKVYNPVEIILHPSADIQIIQVAEKLPGYHKITSELRDGDPIIMGGHGMTATVGQPWGFRYERYGTNKVVGVGSYSMIAVFDGPGSPNATPNEIQAALNDSGGGFFKKQPDGSLTLEGLIFTIGGSWGKGNYNDNTTAYNLKPYFGWIEPYLKFDADMNNDGKKTISDLFVFLNYYYAQNPKADMNKDGVVTIQDLFDFLENYYK